MNSLYEYEIFEKNDVSENELLKTIKSNSGKKIKVLDFEKIKNFPHLIFFAFSERGVIAKTYGAKQLAYNEWKKNGKRTLWLRNLTRDLEIERKNFIDKDAPKELHNCKVVGSVNKNTLSILDEDKKAFLKFASLNSAESEKASRVNYDYMIWDEFNVNSNLVSNIVNKFDSLLHTTENIVGEYGSETKNKIFIFGNNKSLNHPLFLSLKIPAIKKEVSSFWMRVKIGDEISEQPLILLYSPKRDKEYQSNFIKDNLKNKKLLLSILTETADHSYFNESLYDNVNFVENKIKKAIDFALGYNDKLENIFKSLFVVFHKERYYCMYIQQNKNIRFNIRSDYHVIEVDEDIIKDQQVISLNARDVIEGSILEGRNIAKEKLRKILSNNNITFENVVSRELFISSIRN